jgi:2-dehydro-3-deoxyglucarate aldolase/4-hydroxy-2-oxoheptanedioate aldolase
MFESVTGHKNVQEIVAVDGVDMFYFGPSDFSASAGYAGQWEGPGVAQQILEIKDAIRAAGKHCGLLATSVENLGERREQGFQMLGFGSDAGLILRSLHDFLTSVGRDRKLRASLTIDSEES